MNSLHELWSYLFKRSRVHELQNYKFYASILIEISICVFTQQVFIL